MDNEIPEGRDRATKLLEKIADNTKTRCPGLLSRPPELIQWAQTPLSPEAVESLFSRDYPGHRCDVADAPDPIDISEPENSIAIVDTSARPPAGKRPSSFP